MTLYRGIDLLDVVPEDSSGADAAHVRRFADVVDPGPGPFAVAWESWFAAWAATFHYTCQTRAQLATLTTFLANRRGRYAPCWVPTWTRDLTLTVVPGYPAYNLTFVDPGPAVLALLGTQMARYVAVIPTSVAGGASFGTTPLALEDIANNGDGTYTVRTDAVYSGPTLAASQYLVSVLKYARLDTDEVVLDYSTPGLVRAALPFVELPWETV